MSRTLEMLSEPSTQRISISPEWKDWWAGEVQNARTRTKATSSPQSAASSESTTSLEQGPGGEIDGEETKKQVTKKDEGGRDRDQWGGKLPGHGGT
nr:uncharacterized protein I303_08142 [Kwoniella dejecticola CBS 10117]OBR81372.1 hypothetical protein I303_08142 [Kwoniella dejecticola CBS 10117]